MNLPWNTNRLNQWRYSLYTPVYDLVAGRFGPARKVSIDSIPWKPADHVLLVGAGTGLDLQYLPSTVSCTATDLTPLMVQKIRNRASRLNLKTDARVMDGQQLDLAGQSVDHVILHLILAVIPDPVRCLQEAERVLKPGGYVAIFDKFLPDNQQAGLMRRLLNIPATVLATDINRRFSAIHRHTGLELIHNHPSYWNGFFRLILLKKPDITE